MDTDGASRPGQPRLVTTLLLVSSEEQTTYARTCSDRRSCGRGFDTPRLHQISNTEVGFCPARPQTDPARRDGCKVARRTPGGGGRTRVHLGLPEVEGRRFESGSPRRPSGRVREVAQLDRAPTTRRCRGVATPAGGLRSHVAQEQSAGRSSRHGGVWYLGWLITSRSRDRSPLPPPSVRRPLRGPSARLGQVVSLAAL